MTNILHDYPDIPPTPPKPVEQTPCAYCAGTGWRETHIDAVTGLGHGDRCVHCGGRGIVWVELDELRDQAAEARRRLTRARHLP